MSIPTTVMFENDARVWPVQWMSGARLALPYAGIAPGRIVRGVMTLAGAIRASVQLQAESPGEGEQTFQMLDVTPNLSPATEVP